MTETTTTDAPAHRFCLLSTSPSISSLILRLTLGGVMLVHGYAKVVTAGWSASYHGMVDQMHMSPVVVVFVLLMESIGALLLVLGAATRLMAFGFLVEMIGAIALVHGQNGFFMNWFGALPPKEGYEYHLLVIGIALALIVAGAGCLSVDRCISCRRKA